MNQLDGYKRAEMKRMFAAGASIRVIAAQIGCAKNTVTRYARHWRFGVKCWCGKPAGHNGWCPIRIAFSPQRRGWLADEWQRRGSSHLSECVDRAYRESAALGHNLGRFVWGAQSATAYALCGTCGKSVKVHKPVGYFGERDPLDGTALRAVCLTAEERAAQRAALQAAKKEKQEWRSAKRTLVTIQRLLRRPSSRTPASQPAPTSRA